MTWCSTKLPREEESDERAKSRCWLARAHTPWWWSYTAPPHTAQLAPMLIRAPLPLALFFRGMLCILTCIENFTYQLLLQCEESCQNYLAKKVHLYTQTKSSNTLHLAMQHHWSNCFHQHCSRSLTWTSCAAGACFTTDPPAPSKIHLCRTVTILYSILSVWLHP